MLCLVLAAGCSPTLNWRTVAVAEDLDALFPCRVERRSRSGVPLGDARVAMEQTACRAGELTFAVSRAVVPQPVAPQGLVTAWASAAGTNLGATPVDLGARTVRVAPAPAGAPAMTARRVSIEGRLPDGAAVRHEMLLFTRGAAVVQASVLGASPRRDDVEVFFDGLVLKP